MTIDPFIAPPCHQQISILAEDDSFLLIDKPSGLLTLSGKHPANKDSVHYRLVQDYPSASMVHRLDFGTSGVMLVALNKAANANLTKQFQARTIVKKYLAHLHGHLENDEGIIDAPIAKAQFPYLKVCFKTGKQATSHYQVLDRTNDAKHGGKITRVILTPHTGRTHQLRIHSQEIGHPIVGCDLYGSEALDNGNLNSAASDRRLALHSMSLEFSHPLNNERIYIESPTPQLELPYD